MSYPELTIEDAKRYIKEGCDTAVIKTYVVTMTEETARYLLEEVNTDNFREPDNKTIESYVEQRRENLWVPGVADITIGDDGVLDNGQHVLGMIAHGLPTVVRFTVGMQPNSEDVFDTGKIRKSRDVMKHHGVPFEVTGTLRHYLPLADGNRTSTVPPIAAGRIVSIWDANAWVQDNVQEALKYARTLRDSTGVSTPIAAAVYLWMKKHGELNHFPPALVRDYFDGLCGVTGTDEHDPRHFTRRSLQSSPVLKVNGKKRAPGASQEVREKIILAYGYNHWVSGVRAQYGYDAAGKPETMKLSDGSDLPERGVKIPDLTTQILVASRSTGS